MDRCLTEDTIIILQRSDLLMYDRSSLLTMVDAACQILFARSSKSLENTPPLTETDLRQHILEQSCSLIKCGGRAWRKIHIYLIKFSCKQSCRGRCSCRKANLPCTALCFCRGDCSHTWLVLRIFRNRYWKMAPVTELRKCYENYEMIITISLKYKSTSSVFYISLTRLV